MSLEHKRVFIMHGYSEIPGEDPNNQLAVWTAKELWNQHGPFVTFVFPTGIGNSPTIGEKLADQLRELAPDIPPQNILIAPRKGAPTTTIGELRKVRALLQQLMPGMTHVTSVGRLGHHTRIKRDARRILTPKGFIHAFLSPDSILTAVDARNHSNQYSEVLAAWRASEYEAAINRQERFVNFVDSLPFGHIILESINFITRGSRSLNQALLGPKFNRMVHDSARSVTK